MEVTPRPLFRQAANRLAGRGADLIEMNEKGPFNAKQRKRIRSSERRAYYCMLHREYDTRSVARAVSDIIEIAIGNELDQMTGTVY